MPFGLYASNSSAVGNDNVDAVITTLAGGHSVVSWSRAGEVWFRIYDGITPVTSILQANTTTAGNQVWPAVSALDGGGFAVAWWTTGATSNITVQRFDSAGTAVGSETVVSPSGSFAQIAGLSGGGYAVAWYTGTTVMLRAYDSSGTATGSAVQVNATTLAAVFDAEITALSDGSVVVTWSGLTSGGDYDTFAQRYDATGAAVGAETLVDSSQALDSAVAADASGGYAAVVEQGSGGTGTNPAGLYLQFYDNTDTAVGGQVQVTSFEAADFDVTRLNNGDYVVAWANGHEVDFRIFDSAGNPLTGAFVAASSADVIRGAQVSARTDGGFALTWSQQATGSAAGTAYQKVYAASGSAVNGIILIGDGSNESLIGGNGADVILGNGGDDRISGNGGNDYIDGGAGADKMWGGAGDDTYIVDNSSDGASELVTGNVDGGGIDIVMASATYRLANYIENLTLTGTGNIAGIANDLANVIVGNSGNNQISGLGGNDSIDGGAGADKMWGGAGDDTYHVDNVLDQASEQAAGGGDAGGTDTVVSSVTFALASYIENLTLTGAAAINGLGNASNNIITGNNGNNQLSGAGGNDVLDGGKGADRMYGGNGDDTYYVDNTGDVATEIAGGLDTGGTDTVMSSVNYHLGSYIENLTITGQAAIGYGNSMNNTLVAAAAGDKLYGQDGDDLLIGGGNGTTLWGGNGADTFVIATPDDANDRLGDFASGTDHLSLTAADFGFTAGHVLSAGELVNGPLSGVSGTSGQFVFNAATHTLYWDADGAGVTQAVEVALLFNLASLQTSDFIFT